MSFFLLEKNTPPFYKFSYLHKITIPIKKMDNFHENKKRMINFISVLYSTASIQF